MSTSEGYTFKSRKAVDAVAIFHHGRLATTLRGEDATAFLAEVGDPPDQELMARVTGKDKSGNEPKPHLRDARDQQHRGPIGR